MANTTDLLSLLTEQQRVLINENLVAFRRTKEVLLKAQQLSLKNSEYSNLTDDNDLRLKLINSKYKKDIHDAFVKYCLSPKGYESGNNVVFARVANIESADEVNYVNISIVTPSMAYIDNRYFVSGDKNDNEDNNWWSDYRPYYYEFSTIIPDNELEFFISQIKMLKRESDCYNESCFWFKAELTSEEKDKQGEYFGILNFGGSQSFSEGLVFSSFEPIEKDLMKLLKQTYQIKIRSNRNKCANYLDKFFSTSTQFKVNVFNVGQANCIYFEDKNSNKHFFFDYGRPNDEYYDRKIHSKVINKDLIPGSDICKNLESISLLPRDLVIISHWHSDHFAAYKDLDDYGINSVWILPKIDIKYDITSANRFLNYLVENKAEVYYLNSFGEIYNKFGIQLYSSDHPWKSDPNTRGLILKIKDTVFSGDCLYEFWPDDLKSNLNSATRLVVPHHCSRQNKTKKGLPESQKTINCFNKIMDKEAYISVGFNVFGHPNGDHITELSKAKFKIFKTSGSKDGYEFDIT